MRRRTPATGILMLGGCVVAGFLSGRLASEFVQRGEWANVFMITLLVANLLLAFRMYWVRNAQ